MSLYWYLRRLLARMEGI